jgi:hypothetical protein
MNDTTWDVRSVPKLPFARPDVLHASPMYHALYSTGPVVRVVTPTGDPAWLVVAYQEAREAFADRRLGDRRRPHGRRSRQRSGHVVSAEEEPS